MSEWSLTEYPDDLCCHSYKLIIHHYNWSIISSQTQTRLKHEKICLSSLFCSIDLCVCSYSSTRLFWLQWPCNIVWYQYCDPSYFVLVSQNCWAYSGPSMVPYKFLKYLFYIYEVCYWYFNKDCIESINCFR